MCVGSEVHKITLWFGKEIDIEHVRFYVKLLRQEGYIVRAPFYIGYNLNNDIVRHYLKNSLDESDALFLLGKEGSLLEEILEYAGKVGKPVYGKDNEELCLKLSGDCLLK